MTEFEKKLADYLPDSDNPLHQAMRYSVLNGGKRLRPQLVYAAGEISQGKVVAIHNAACAVEYIHVYSLIHDDLPSMDNDDFRRGKPSCHKVYGDATAILAGDALQSLAFEILAQNNNSQLIYILAQAIGCHGMAYGQSLDINNKHNLNNNNSKIIHSNKTAKLIIASVQLGYLCGDTVSESDFLQLTQFGENLGLAFQYQDDFLDGENSDQNNNYPHFYQKALLNLKNLNNINTIKNLENITHNMINRVS